MATIHEPRDASGSDPRLADHAATAALYVTDPERRRSVRVEPPSDTETLEAMDPSVSPPGGLTLASASAAASLAHANQRPLEFWKPEKQPAAERAAYHAKDYRVELPQPSRPTRLSTEGMKAAAVLAARDSRAATTRSPPPPNPKYNYLTEEQVIMSGGRVKEDNVVPSRQKGALLAATGALRSSRRRAESAPVEPIDPEAGYALSAATISHRARPVSEVLLEDIDRPVQASRIHNIARANVQLYTSNPPVDIETEEQNKRDTLRAAALSMAKGMYAVSRNRDEQVLAEQGLADQAIYGAQRGHYRMGQRASLTGIDEAAVPQRSANLQLAAQRLASEKLARMQRENEDYERYYGTAPPLRTRLSVAGKLRRRTSSEGEASRVDMERSIRIRNQMSTLHTQLHQVDEKRRRDREDLMEVARRNVHAAIQDIDERVYADTGKPSPAMQREWEEKAQERARIEIESRPEMGAKVDIGRQRYVDPVDVEAVAWARIRPTLDEINERAEEQKAKEIEQRLDEEERRRKENIEREREAELRAEQKKQRAASKQEAKQRKIVMAEQEFLDRDDEWRILRRKSKRVKSKEPTANGGPPSAAPEATSPQETRGDESGAAAGAAEKVSPTSTSPKGESKLKTWFRERLGNRATKAAAPTQETTKETTKPEQEENTSGFVGGAALTGVSVDDPRGAALKSNPVTGNDLAQPAVNGHSDHDANNDNVPESSGALRQWSTSTAPSETNVRQSKDTFQSNGESRRSRLRTNLKNMITRKSEERGSNDGSALSSPKSPTAQRRDSAVPDSSRPEPVRADTAERNELRDSFQEQSLPAPPIISSLTGRASNSPVRDSKFSEDL